MVVMRTRTIGVGVCFAGVMDTLHAGMTVYDLTDVVRTRLEDISFFGLLFVAAVFGVRCLWNGLARDLPKLPRLSVARAFCLTTLMGLAMLLVLVMISGARELLTPGAWRRQGSHYRPNDMGNMELRRQSMGALRTALLQYAQAHDGQYPAHDFVAEIPARLWEAPDSTGSRYLYLSGRTQNQSNQVLAIEPEHFGPERLVLFAGGEVRAMTSAAIYGAFAITNAP